MSTLNALILRKHLIMSTGIPEYVYNWLKNIQFILLPGICIQCRKTALRDRDLCLDCEQALPRIRRPCLQCGLPLPPGHYRQSVCGTCLVYPPSYSRLLAPFIYRPPVSSLVSAYKYQGRLVNGRVLTESFTGYVRRQYAGAALPSLLVPVPSHRRRIRQRGFNQALEIARWLSRELAVPLAQDLVSRNRYTSQQTGMSARERKKNLKNAFQVNHELDPDTVVAIVDDVVTTGTTVSELAKALKKAGAGEIHVWALARTCL